MLFLAIMGKEGIVRGYLCGGIGVVVAQQSVALLAGVQIPYATLFYFSIL